MVELCTRARYSIEHEIHNINTKQQAQRANADVCLNIVIA